jgi:hypothetical protein
MNLVRIFYIGAMALGGVALGVASLRWPVIHDGPVPPLMSLLMISLVMDLVIMNRAAEGKMEPLQMNERLAGFFAGAILYFVLHQSLAG